MGKTGSVSVFLLLLLSIPILARAQLAITEVMFDVPGTDTGREWIEVQNVGAETLVLSEWKLYEAEVNHGLTTDGSDALAPGSFAIIADDPAKFRVDWPAYSGLVMNSAFSLNNAGESLALRCCGKDATDRDTVSYTGDSGAGDGNSLHRNGSSWTLGAPTPGSGAIAAPIVSEEQQETREAESTPSTSATKSGGAISLEAGTDRTVLAKSSIQLHARVVDTKKQVVETAGVVWNLGDARSATGAAITHTWGYPGKYRVSVRATHRGEFDDDAFVVEVVAPEFDFVRFDDGSVGLRNRSHRDADVSRWRIHDESKNFVIPDGTIVLKGVLLRVAPETIGFMTTRPSLHYPDGSVYATSVMYRDDAPEIIAQVVVPAPPPREPEPELEVALPAQKTPEPEHNEARIEEEEEVIPDEPPPVEPEAQVAAAAVLAAEWHWWLGALALSLVGAVGMYAAQRREKDPLDGWKIEDGSEVE